MRFVLSLVVSMALAVLLSAPVRAASDGIGWVPSWEQALSEARATNKPIMLVSAAPQCGGVPGVW